MSIAQPLAVIVLAPLLQGLLRSARARFSGRPGPVPWQPYRDLWKLAGKEALATERTSWVFLAAPGAVLGVALTFVWVLPPLSSSGHALRAFDPVALVLLLALGRFVLVLAALDTRSSFEDMAAGREITFGALTEAPLILALVGGALAGGTLGGLLAACALLLVMLSETARIPVDNQETHYELTMIHEGLLLEYSGWHLAAVQAAAYLRQAAFFLLAAFLLSGAGAIALLWVLGLAAFVALLESVSAKWRLFDVPQLFSAALVLAVAALGIDLIGGVR